MDLVAAAGLACPACSAPLERAGQVLGCAAGHRFDVARQGYVSLLTGKGTAHRADTADMVASRAAVFEAGVYQPIVSAVAAAAADGDEPIVDAGAGTGAYLASALDSGPVDRVGVAVDLSKTCARAAARCHPRAVSVVADIWQAVPVRDHSASTVLSVFAPRNPAETARVLRPGGHWVIVTPNPGHLAEVIDPMGMLRVGHGKSARLAADLHDAFDVVRVDQVRARRTLDAPLLAHIAGMGPAGFHRTRDELAAAASALAADGAVTATLDVTLTLARRRD